jgi:hypothetical protein
MYRDIYLYTLYNYICCLLWRMYEMHPALSFKTGCYTCVQLRDHLVLRHNDPSSRSGFILTMLCMLMIRFRRYLFTYFTWKTLSNHVFEDLRKPKAPNTDPTLFTKTCNGDRFVCQIYVDDIIFGSTNQKSCEEFSRVMMQKFEM